jgi:hypothetical protein
MNTVHCIITLLSTLPINKQQEIAEAKAARLDDVEATALELRQQNRRTDHKTV